MGSIRFHRGLVLSSSKGFSLIELLVVLAIITVISAVVITSQSTFNKTLILQNTAYNIALTLRTAETFGIGSRVTGTSASFGYGLAFSSSFPNRFVLYADTSGGTVCGSSDKPDCKSGDHVYTGGSDAIVQTYLIGNRMTVSDFCVYSGSWLCKSSATNGLTSLNILFTRPNPDAFISANGAYSLSNTKACITVTSPQGGAQFISVSGSGQIVAKATSCP